jgi:hypothetical protein
MIVDFEFPVVSFSKTGLMYIAKNIDDLSVCSNRGWRSGFYSGLTIVDSSGMAIKIREARKIGTVGFLWGLSLVWGQRIKVELIEEGRDKMAIDRFKERVCRQLEKDRHFWNSGGNLDNSILNIKMLGSHKEINEYLSKVFYESK